MLTWDLEEYGRRERIDGVEYMMAPPGVNHIRVRQNIDRIFASYLKKKRCQAFSEVGVWLNDGRDQVIPDVAILCDKGKLRHDGIHGAPDLVVEVLSPGTSKKDRTVKKALYERSGVKEYWLADPKGKSVEAYKLRDGQLLLDEVYHALEPYEWESLSAEDQQRVKLSLVSLYDDLEIDVRDIFEEVE